MLPFLPQSVVVTDILEDCVQAQCTHSHSTSFGRAFCHCCLLMRITLF